VPISFAGCVGRAICATTIKGVPLRLLQNVQGVAELVPTSFRVCVGHAICAATIKGVPLRLSQMAKVRPSQMDRGCAKRPRLSVIARAGAFASNAESRAYTPAAFAKIVTCGTVGAVNPSAFASNAESRTYTPVAFAKLATNETVSGVNAIAFASNAESRVYTPAAFAKIVTCGTVGAITG
jgi:hypothetical protein